MTLDSALGSLRVPPDFNRYADIPEKDVIARLDQWKDQAVRTLQDLQTRIQQERASLSLKHQADVVSATSVFDADATWVTSESRAFLAVRSLFIQSLCHLNTASDILQEFSEPPLPLVVQILQHNVKPLFRSNPHPSINLETGRKLARPAGGPMASQDFYDSQTWKDYPGASNIVLCVGHIPVISSSMSGLQAESK